MAYRIPRSESAEAALQRLILDQNRKALKLLRAWHKDPTDRIHRSRQCFRRIRAVLLLLHSDAPYIHAVENRFYRDLARTLADARDADAMIDAIDFLAERFAEEAPPDSLAMLRTSLVRRAKADLECSIVDVAARCQEAAVKLERADRRLHLLPLRGMKRKQVKRSVRKGLERCTKAFKKARRTRDEDDFHAWRKQVKYSYYNARLIQDVSPRWARIYTVPLRELAELLGNRQDLYVLDGFLASQPDGLGIDIHVRAIRDMIASSQGSLEVQALNLGERLFGSGRTKEAGRFVTLHPRVAYGGDK